MQITRQLVILGTPKHHDCNDIVNIPKTWSIIVNATGIYPRESYEPLVPVFTLTPAKLPVLLGRPFIWTTALTRRKSGCLSKICGAGLKFFPRAVSQNTTSQSMDQGVFLIQSIVRWIFRWCTTAILKGVPGRSLN